MLNMLPVADQSTRGELLLDRVSAAGCARSDIRLIDRHADLLTVRLRLRSGVDRLRRILRLAVAGWLSVPGWCLCVLWLILRCVRVRCARQRLAILIRHPSTQRRAEEEDEDEDEEESSRGSRARPDRRRPVETTRQRRRAPEEAADECHNTRRRRDQPKKLTPRHFDLFSIELGW
jgi:hypothetical protein